MDSTKIQYIKSLLREFSFQNIDNLTDLIRKFPGNEKIDLAGLRMFYSNYQRLVVPFPHSPAGRFS